ncbi:hypothetical protein WISP_93788 [Willisornis vidua]|uniref:Uncharacterized protein n=1 Tax=Willisornis vidua TaxID=1566151 RepID=A0ABQ9D0K7_9PASS|nr:hypothetical protein WISP_93788 [Willisornis vidua]
MDSRAEDLNYYCAQYKAKLLPLLRELRAADEDPVSSFISLLKKKEEVRCLEKALAEKEEVTKMGGCSDMVGRALGYFGGWKQQAGGGFCMWAVVSHSLWCCQAFRERMEVIAEQWNDLHARRDQLKAYMESCKGTVQVHLPCSTDVTLSHTINSSPPLGKKLGPAHLAKPLLSWEV